MSDIITALKALKLHGMAASYAELAAQDTAAIAASEWLIRHLLEAESTDRAIRSIGYQMHAAKFPVHRDLASFDFSQSVVARTQIEQLSDLSFTKAAHNAVFIGGTGTGKTHLATALGVAGICQHGKRVRFFSTIELVNALELEKAAGKQGRLAFSLGHMDLVILDELGYLPFSQAGGALLFHLLSKLYERTSVVITIMWNWRNIFRQHFLQLPHAGLSGVGVVFNRVISRSMASLSPSTAARSSSVRGISCSM